MALLISWRLILAVPLNISMWGITLARENIWPSLRYMYLVALFGSVVMHCTPEHGNEIIRKRMACLMFVIMVRVRLKLIRVSFGVYLSLSNFLVLFWRCRCYCPI